MKKRSALVLGLCAAVLLVVLCGCLSAEKDRTVVPEYVFTYAENQEENYPTAKGASHFAQLVEQRTNGRIRINVYPNGELGDEPSVLRQMQYGGVDFARVSVMTMADEVPLLNILQLPYLYEDADHLWKVLDGGIGDEFLAALDGSGVVGLSWYDAGARHFYSRTGAITKLEDFAGLRIRVAESSLMEDLVRALGAQPVTVPFSEVYSELETEALDGAENNWPSYASQRHWEVASYITLDAHSRIPELQLCAQSTWDALSAEDQQVLRECAEESSRYERQLWAEAEREAQDAIGTKCTVVRLSAEEIERFRAAMQPVYDKYGAAHQNLIRRIRQMGGN